MSLTTKAENVKRYKDFIMLFMKYGRSETIRASAMDPFQDSETVRTPKMEEEARHLAADLEKMGPTFIKLAQLLSTRADILPVPYLEALTRLQDKVEPFSFAEAEKIVTEELGVRISKAFSEFPAEPIASASLGQVYHAKLREGRDVAVKVQRPGIRERIVQDLDALERAAAMIDHHTVTGRKYEFGTLFGEFKTTILNELDYRKEAQNLTMFRENLKDFTKLVIPSAVPDYTTSKVLTMEYISGEKVTNLSPLVRLDLNGQELAEQLFKGYLKQILVDGIFHADPHPGNVFLTDDHHLALIDLGMVGRLNPGIQEDLLQLLLAISEGRGDEAAGITIRIGEPRKNFDKHEFYQKVAQMVVQNYGNPGQKINAGRVVLLITRFAADCDFRLPREYPIIAKTLMNLDQIVYTLDPTFDPNASIRRNAIEITNQRLFKSISPGKMLSSAVEIKEFMEKIPKRLNNLLDMITRNELEVKVHTIDESKFIQSFQKVANRITLGLILAALIIGASLIMRVETNFRIFGYPGLAIIFFLLAAGGGVAMAFHILFHDEKENRHRNI